jgi:hypothetical protein
VNTYAVADKFSVKKAMGGQLLTKLHLSSSGEMISYRLYRIVRRRNIHRPIVSHRA